MRPPSLPESIQPCLLARPDPFQDESPASWVQRLTGAHRYSLSRLSQVTKIHPRRADWDYSVSNEEWSKLLKLADVDATACGEARFALNTFRCRLRKHKHLFHVQERPSYRWCPACFSSDSIPYLRWHWRLAACTRCQVHQCRLEEQCPWCNSPLSVHRALLVSAGCARGALDLSRCGGCGMPLADTGDTSPDDSPGNADPDQVSALINQLREAYRQDGDQFEFDFSYFDDEPTPPKKALLSADVVTRAFEEWDPKRAREQSSSSLQDESVCLDTCINRSSKKQGPAFQLNGYSFVDTSSALAEPQRTSRWTDGIRPRDRRRLARALRVIRDEQRELRRLMLQSGAKASEPNLQ